MFQRVPRIASIRLYSEYFSYRKIYRFLIKHTQTALAVQTNRLKNDILLDVGEKYSSKIHVIGNPLDTELIKEKMKEEPEGEFLERIRGKKVICFTASFKTAKNHWNLIKSFNLLHKDMPETVLVLIGGQGELEEKIRFLYGLCYIYFSLYSFLQKNKWGLELILKLHEKQNEHLRLIVFVKDQL